MTAAQLGFDVEARDQALARVLSHTTDEWKAVALKAIAKLAGTGRDFQAHDLVAAGVPEPDHKSRWGGIFAEAHRIGLIEQVGYARSNRTTVRGSATMTWRGADVTPVATATIPVKALSLARPWAWAVLHAGKDVENRKWTTNYRGLLVIHASQTWLAADTWYIGAPAKHDHPTGYVGAVELYDICTRSARGLDCPHIKTQSHWGEIGHNHWLLRDPVALAVPVPGKGRLQLFTPPLDVITRIERARP